MSLAKLLCFTYVLVISQAKITHRTVYEDVENLNSMEETDEERSNIELPFDMDDLREDERFVNTLAVADDRQAENHKRTPVRMPAELIRLLKNAKSFSEAKRIFNSQFVKRGEENMIEKREGGATSVAATIKCPVPRHATVKTTYASSSASAIPLYVPGNGIDSACAPHPTTVQLNPPANAFYHPASIRLHRCAGYCPYVDPDVFQCELTAQTEIKYSVYQISHTSYSPVEIKVMNHTACACGCVIKEHHCDAETMRYNKNICRCECINNESSCNPSIKKWNPSHCKCECKFPPTQCSAGQEWSTETCACQ